MGKYRGRRGSRPDLYLFAHHSEIQIDGYNSLKAAGGVRDKPGPEGSARQRVFTRSKFCSASGQQVVRDFAAYKSNLLA